MFAIVLLMHPSSSLTTKILSDLISLIISMLRPSSASGENAPPAPSTRINEDLASSWNFLR